MIIITASKSLITEEKERERETKKETDENVDRDKGPKEQEMSCVDGLLRQGELSVCHT
jgi:hypothetical protein